MSLKNNRAQAHYKNCGCGEGAELINGWPDQDQVQQRQRSANKHTHGSRRNESMRFGKSRSDTVVLAKGCTHPKALSTNRLNVHQAEHLPQFEESTDSASSSDTFLGDSLHKANMCDRSEEHLSSLDTETGSEDQEIHTDLRHRKAKRAGHNLENKTEKSEDHDDGVQGKQEDGLEKSWGADEPLFDEQQLWKESRAYYICWMILTVLSLLTRIYNIEVPAHVWLVVLTINHKHFCFFVNFFSHSLFISIYNIIT